MILNNFHIADAVYFASKTLVKPICPTSEAKTDVLLISRFKKPHASKLIESYTSITILTQNGDDRSSTWRTSLRATEDNSNLQRLTIPTLCLSKEHQFPASAQTSTDLDLRRFSHGRVQIISRCCLPGSMGCGSGLGLSPNPPFPVFGERPTRNENRLRRRYLG